MTTLTIETERETGRKMAEVDYVIGAPFAVTWQNVPRSRAFWAGYAIGWVTTEEVELASKEEREEWIRELTAGPDTDEEARFELDLDYAESMWS